MALSNMFERFLLAIRTNCPAAWFNGNVVAYRKISPGSILDCALVFFSNRELCRGIHGLGICVLQYPLFMFTPVLPSKETPALS